MIQNAKNTRGRKPTGLLGALIAAVSLCALAAPASALAAPVLQVDSSHYPAVVSAGTHAQYKLIVRNTGDVNTTGPVTLDFTVPAGLRVIRVTSETYQGFFGGPTPLWNCSTPDSQSARCVGPDAFGHVPIEPGKEACKDVLIFGFIPVARCRITVLVKVDPGVAPGVVNPTLRTSGGGSVDFNGTDPTEVGPPAEFALTGFDGRVLKANGDPATQAGSHPDSGATEFTLKTVVGSNGLETPVADLKDVTVKLPAGFVGNPQAYPRCTQAQMLIRNCASESQLGHVFVWVSDSPGVLTGGIVGKRPVFNMVSGGGTPGLFAFWVQGTVVQVYPRVRTGGDYGVDVLSVNAPGTVRTARVDFTFWGVPADASHDADRYFPVPNGEGLDRTGAPSTAPLKPFLSLPTNCVGTGPNNSVETTLTVTNWQSATTDSASFFSHDNTVPTPNPIGPEGCETLTYTGPNAPSIEARPTTNVADSPSGLDVDLRIPQNYDEICPPAPGDCGSANAHLDDTIVTLPEGLVVNPASANGLDGCSISEFGYTSTDPDGTIHTTPEAARCPGASKLATVQVDTPLLDHPVEGAAYIADPYQNPFNSLLALYIALDDPQTGVVVKVAGEVRADPVTGRLTTTVKNNPQLPFENFRLHFFGGAGGSLRTPAICGNHTSTSSLTPWSGAAAATPSDTWAITQNCVNSPGDQPHAPSFDAGAISPISGTHSPFVVKLRREDGSQNFSALTVKPPQGLVATLAGTPMCPDSALNAAAVKSGNEEKANPSCPAASEVGTVSAGAGAGPAPYYAPGKAYLAGPYKGAPLSLAVITPATAGPFDLGTVVVKTALHVDSKTAEITAVSDPIPHILQGIPLDVRSIDIAMDKPQFTLNPTSCDPMAVSGQLTSILGAIAPLESRFQLGECGRLGFKPKLALSLKGGTKRGKHPALTGVLTPRPGDANIAYVSVALPRSEFLENAHIRTICTRAQFASDTCPAAAIYGEATVDTPLLDYDLTGHVYLRSSDNLLPDLVPDLRGPASQPIRIESAGRTDSIRGGIRNTFDFVPDAPFTKFTLSMQGGQKGLLVNSRNICDRVYRATVEFVAHNGLTHTARPALRARCGKKGKKSAKGKRGAARKGR